MSEISYMSVTGRSRPGKFSPKLPGQARGVAGRSPWRATRSCRPARIFGEPGCRAHGRAGFEARSGQGKRRWMAAAQSAGGLGYGLHWPSGWNTRR